MPERMACAVETSFAMDGTSRSLKKALSTG
jgi:hypothetical protein